MMRIRIAAALLLCALFTTPCAAGRYISGQVVYVGKDNEETPAVGVDVAMKETGNSDKTKANGLFRIFLPDAFKPGEDVTLHVAKEQWVIWSPIAGQARIPADLAKKVEVIKLLKRSDLRLKSSDAIQRFIADAVRSAKEQVKGAGPAGKLNLDPYIKEWAVHNGFPVQQVRKAIDKWVADVERNEADLVQRSLAASVAHRLHNAFELATQSAQARIQRDAVSHPQDFELTREIVRDYQLAGDAAYSNYDFTAALQAYELALQRTSRNDTPVLWAETKVLIGNAAQQLGTRSGGEPAMTLLARAVAAYRDALEVCTRSSLPHNWAIAQSNLGNALQEQGKRSSGEEEQRLLAEATTAYRSALEVLTRNDMPLEWAMVQNNLAAALVESGSRSGDETDRLVLGEAVKRYRAALEIRTRQQIPQDWRATQNNLGVALRRLGTITGGTAGQQLLRDAVATAQAALEARIPEDVPDDRAMLQTSLGLALQELGVHTEGEAPISLLSQAVTAHRGAIEIYTRRNRTQDRAASENDLGIALQELGKRSSGEPGQRFLREAVAAYRGALKVYARNDFPQRWAEIQTNLAGALKEQSTRSSAVEQRQLLSGAAAAYQGALEVFTGRSEAARRFQVQRAFIGVAEQLQDWEMVAQTGLEMLRHDADDAEIYSVTAHLLQGKLYRFEDAYALTRAWLEKHTGDPSELANFAECHLTTGRFADAVRMIEPLLASDALELKTKFALRALRVVALTGEGEGNQASSELELMKQLIRQQPAEFKLAWEFAGTSHFIDTSPAFSYSRAQLLKLLEALQAKDRAGILAGIDQIDATARAQ